MDKKKKGVGGGGGGWEDKYCHDHTCVNRRSSLLLHIFLHNKSITQETYAYKSKGFRPCKQAGRNAVLPLPRSGAYGTIHHTRNVCVQRVKGLDRASKQVEMQCYRFLAPALTVPPITQETCVYTRD